MSQAGLLWFTGKSEKRGLGGSVRVLSWEELLLPIAPLLASLRG